MSVKVHEPVCEDSAQDLYFWFDHFLGDQLKGEWNETGTGSAAVVDAQTGGIVRITTGATNGNAYWLDWADIRSLHVNKKVTFECRVKVNDNTQCFVYLALRYDGDNWVMFYTGNVAGADDWEIWCEDNNVVTRQESGITLDTSYHIYRIECFPTGEVHFYIDGVEPGTSPITTNIPDDVEDFLQPYLYIHTREDVAKSMDVDYVVVRQER